MIVFLTNYLNLHQLPFTLAMHDALGNDFRFISTSPITKARLAIGFEDLDIKYDFVIRAYQNDKEKKRAEKLINECDVLLAGSVEDRYLMPRLKHQKLTIRYSERYFRNGYGLRAFASAMKHLAPFQHFDSLFYLCNSAYTPADLNKFTHFKNQPLKWGYFPENRVYEDIGDIIEKKEENSILWCARMLELKHPEHVVEVARKLKTYGKVFKLYLIGDGEKYEEIEKMVEEYEVKDCVFLLGSVEPRKVRNMMEKCEIFMFTSDKREGWGAVLNEAMNGACAVVSSHEIGATPFLIKHESNGMIYHDGDVDDLFRKVMYLLDNPHERKKMAMNAYETINTEWNGAVAAERLLKTIKALQKGNRKPLYTDGPCSTALVINDNWFTLKK